jgi:transposase
MVKRYGLRDDQWERFKDLLPGRKESVGVTARDNRLFVEAVLYRYRAGIAWRDLPERFGDWKIFISSLPVFLNEKPPQTLKENLRYSFPGIICHRVCRRTQPPASSKRERV